MCHFFLYLLMFDVYRNASNVGQNDQVQHPHPVWGGGCPPRRRWRYSESRYPSGCVKTRAEGWRHKAHTACMGLLFPRLWMRTTKRSWRTLTGMCWCQHNQYEIIKYGSVSKHTTVARVAYICISTISIAMYMCICICILCIYIDMYISFTTSYICLFMYTYIWIYIYISNTLAYGYGFDIALISMVHFSVFVSTPPVQNSHTRFVARTKL